MTQYILGALAGLCFGSLVAWANSRLTARYLKKCEDEQDPAGSGAAGAMLVNVERLFVDAAALALVFFTRRFIPLPYMATLVGTAVGLTVISYILLLRITGGKK